MKKRGFIPFAAVGVILIIISASLVAYFEWNRHYNVKTSLNESYVSSLSSRLASGRNDLKRQARESLYQALWQVSKNVDENGDLGDQEKRVEEISSRDLNQKLPLLMDKKLENPLYPKLNVGSKKPKIEINPAEGGYVDMKVKFPDNTFFSGSSPDDTTEISSYLDNIRSEVDVRFFLLQNRMEEFEEELYRVKRRWKYAEYASAYIQAWKTGGINLSKDRTKGLFRISLASHEINHFGSTDYRAIAQDWLNYFTDIDISNLQDSNNVVEPVPGEEIGILRDGIDKSISKMRKSSVKLESVVDEVMEFYRYEPGKELQGKLDDLIYLEEEDWIDRSDSILKKFRKICKSFRRGYSFPHKKSEKALEKISKVENLVRGSWGDFLEVSRYMENLSDRYTVVKHLYEDFTEGEDPPGVFLQIREGVKNTLENIDLLRGKVKSMRDPMENYIYLDNIFPSDYEESLSQYLIEENEEMVERLILKSVNSARAALRRFEIKHEKNRKKTKSLFQEVIEAVEKQVRIPESNWEESYKKYSEPGEDVNKHPKEEIDSKFVIKPGTGSIGGIENVLKNVKSQFNRLGDLFGDFQEKRAELEEFEMNQKLKSYIKEGPRSLPVQEIEREKIYETFTPEPLLGDPGISVYHEVEIEEVEYDREDPLGLIYKGAPPTPIYLWFIDTVIYWAMWNVKIELKDPLVEEIYDYKNQTIPRPLIAGSDVYVHKPLAYRREIQKTDFNFRLLVFSLRNFDVSYS